MVDAPRREFSALSGNCIYGVATPCCRTKGTATREKGRRRGVQKVERVASEAPCTKQVSGLACVRIWSFSYCLIYNMLSLHLTTVAFI